MVANNSVAPAQLLTFAYDYKGRRISKTVWNNTTGFGNPATSLGFAYDGWNLIAELNTLSAPALVRSYVWGSDLSGRLQGAGGVGGLLEMTYHGAQTTNCFATFDGNGNLAALLNAADSSLVAQYEYGPFGEVIRATGVMAKASPFRFSTKYQDDETDLLYYGYRYYNPSTGRWNNRDTIEEVGGLNLYGFVLNGTQCYIDILGLSRVVGPQAGIFSWIAQFNPESLDWRPFVSAYTALTGQPVDTDEFRSRLSTALYALAGSYNPPPSDPFDVTTKETRGWLKAIVMVNCCGGQVDSYKVITAADDGWTPMRPLPGFDRADGNADNLNPKCYVNGDRVYCDVLHRSRIGPLGRRLFANLFPGVGVPYNWRRIEYVLRCDGGYRIDYFGSFFPSHRAYLGASGVATWDQSALAGFMFAGNAVDAPGGSFHFESGAGR